ncbi:MAG: hypothetical protein ABI197_03570 [Granulicella sp.]
MKDQVAEPLLQMFIKAKLNLEVLNAQKKVQGAGAPDGIEIAAIERIEQIVRNNVMSLEDRLLYLK